MQPDPIRIRYVTEFTKLSLWYVHKALREGEADFAGVVNLRVNIYRNTGFYDGQRHPAHEDVGPEWAEVLRRLGEAYDRHRGSAEAFETEGLALLRPHLGARLRRDRERGEQPRDRPYECWTFDYGGKGDRLNLHIANVYRPRSPLSEMKVPFAASLIRLLRDSRLSRPGVEVARCGSWLNGMPAFQALFPERWGESARLAREVRYGMGYWGQFTDRRGDFHARNGAALRETGKFPFPSLTCECPIPEVLAHLDAGFPEAVQYNADRGYVPRS
jgi:hypothetical protein